MAQGAERPSFEVSDSQPLIGIPFEENGHRVTRYFADEAAADTALGDNVTADALNLAGAWSDLDFDDVVAALDRIRHESRPTPPIELDV